MSAQVLMVCSGNLCRSPMAEAVWNHRLNRENSRLVASSAGLYAVWGEAMHPHTAAILQERGITLPAHGSRPVSPDNVRSAELILVMNDWQKSEIMHRAPYLRGRVFTLGHWRGFEVPDPMGEPRAVFETAYALIDQGVTDWLAKLQSVRAAA